MLVTVVLAIDPWGYRSFTAPKYTLFFVLLPIFISLVWYRIPKVAINVVLLLYLIRIIWLSATNIEWVTHPSNDSFLLTLGIGFWMFLLLQFGGKNEKKLFVWSIFLIGLVQVFIGIAQLVIYEANPSLPIKTPFIGTLGTSNGLGILLVISFFCGVSLTAATKRKLLSLIGSLFLLIGILLSKSRGSILVLIVVMGFIFVLNTSRSVSTAKKAVTLVFATVIAGTVLFLLYLMDVESSSGRWILWEISWMMFQDNIWNGVGQGNYAVEFLNYQAEYFAIPEHIELGYKASNIKQAHNEYLQAFATGGIPGGMLFLSIWLTPLYWFIKRELVSDQRFGASTLQLTIHLSIVLHSLLDSPLHVFPIAFIGYSNLILISIDKHELKTHKVFQNVVYLVLFITTLVSSYHFVVKYQGQYSWKKGVEQTVIRNWDASIIHLSNALERMPKQGELMYQLGASHIFDGQYSRGLYLTNESKKYFNDKNIYLSESYAHVQLKEYESAEEKALTALSMFPTQLAPQLLLGEIYFYQGRFEESKVSLQKCIDEDTPIKSPDTKQISVDAQELWNRFY